MKKKLYKSAKLIRNHLDKKCYTTLSKVGILHDMNIISDIDYENIIRTLEPAYQKAFEKTAVKIRFNSVYGLLTQSIKDPKLDDDGTINDIDESSMYPTKMINVEMPSPMTGHMIKTCNNPTVAKSHTIVKVRKREL